MAAADYRIEREPDYARWLVQFEARLRALPDEKRQRSVLPVLQGYAKPQTAGPSGIDSSVFVAAVSRLPMQPVPHIGKPLIDRDLEVLRLLDVIGSPTRSPFVASALSSSAAPSLLRSATVPWPAPPPPQPTPPSPKP